MNKRRTNFGYFLKEGVKSVFKHGAMSFAAVITIVACLLILGSFGLVLLNVSSLVERLEQDNEILAFVDDSVSDTDARSLGTEINRVPNVASATFVTRQEAMQSFISQFDDPSIFDGVSEDTFRHRYIIVLEDVTLMSLTKSQVEGIAGVAKVNAMTELAAGFMTVRSILRVVTVILGAVLIVVSLFIISNTVRLSTYSRREEIAVMKTVGATNGFIRLPFVFQGIIIGILGAAIAFFAQWGIYDLACVRITGSVSIQSLSLIGFTSVLPEVAIVFGLSGFLVGTLGSAWSIRRFLRV